MKQAFSLLVLVVMLSGCKKAIEQAQEDYVVKAMTTGQWMVKTYIKGGSDVTASFNSYSFQFYDNRTVEARKNSQPQMTGTWEGNASAKTIYANYTTTSEPLSLLNGTWTIINSSLVFVEASLTVNGEQRSLRLEKL